MKTHHDLLAWQEAIALVTDIYTLTREFPKEELYGLISQIRRSAVSIPSNIAEGASRNSKNEFKQYLYIALASGSELETQLIISKNLSYISEGSFNILLDKLISIQKKIQGLIKSCK
jgi:four helix bundle protein